MSARQPSPVPTSLMRRPETATQLSGRVVPSETRVAEWTINGGAGGVVTGQR